MSKESAMAMLTGNPVATPQAPVAEVPQSTPTATPQESFKSDPFAHLAKKEEQLLKDKLALKSEREALEKDRGPILEAKKKYDEFLAKKAEDPVAAMKLLGFSETDIMNYLAAQAPPELTPEERAAKAAREATEAKIKEFEDLQTKKQQEAQTKADQGLIHGYKSEIKSVMSANPDTFEYCSYYGVEAENLAFEIAQEVVKKSNGEDFVDAKEALQMAEEYFEERDKEMAALKKRQRVSQPPAPAEKTEPTRSRTLSTQPNQDAPKPTITKTRTLHNGATSTVASTRMARNETREEKRDRLMNALRNGKL